MTTAELFRELEQRGFDLDFPSARSAEEIILELLKEKNERLKLAIPLLLREPFEYGRLRGKLSPDLKKQLDKIILISEQIFRKEGLEQGHLLEMIKENKLKAAIPKAELQYYLDAFRESLERQRQREASEKEEQIGQRARLTLNQALSELFSPAKRRIMEKIFRHEKLTNTELKYYYRSIKPIGEAISNKSLQEYAQIINSIKKYSEKP